VAERPPARARRSGTSRRTAVALIPVLLLLAVAAAAAALLLSSGDDGGAGGGAADQQARETPASGRSEQAEQPAAPTRKPKQRKSKPERSEPEAAAPPAAEPAPSEPVTAVDPARGAQLNSQGFALMQRGDYAGAVPILEQAVASWPEDSTEIEYAYALYNLGKSLNRSGRSDEAIPYLEKRLRWDDQRATVQAELDLARRNAGQG
jgi:tetratricopeptide (TPR) repeat protein